MRLVVQLCLGVWCVLALTACGGGGGGGGGDNDPRYSISVSQSSLAFSYVSQRPAPVQRITVNFVGDGVVIGSLPGQTVPYWVSVSAPTQATSPMTVEISAATGTPGNYSTTLRFATGRSDGTNVVYTDVNVTLQAVEGKRVRVEAYGVISAPQVAVSLNNEAPQTLQTPPNNQILGAPAVGTTYSLAVTSQPAHQHCTFPNGASSISEVAASGPAAVLYRLTCNVSLIPWTWVGGSQTEGASTVYGMRGTPSVNNAMGSRLSAAFTADAAGNLWGFGGRGPSGLHNDLWRYDIATGAWTWISGSNTTDQRPIHGTRNVPASSNMPGGRDGAVAWFDASGDFWLFGGSGLAAGAGMTRYLNDLWKYDVDANVWTWVSGRDGADGDLSGIYGTTPSVNNFPGGRNHPAMVKDASGAVWIFGGSGQGAGVYLGLMNDLWRFDPATAEWSWVSGANQPETAGVYGTRGVPSPSNVPSPRSSTPMWADASGNLWIFGGGSSLPLYYENDLWRYDPASDQWTWMGGASPDQFGGRYGTYGLPDASTTLGPAGRVAGTAWTDASGNLWLFGGYGNATGADRGGPLNDLWKYVPATGTWQLFSGSNSPASPSVYGTQWVGAATNVPSGRDSGAAWADPTGRLWLYGGRNSTSSERLTDVWYVTPQ